MRPNGNPGASNNNAKPVVFHSLETTNSESTSLLGANSQSGRSLAGNLSTFTGLSMDLVVALYILAFQLPLTRMRTMNYTGLFTALMSMALLFGTGARIVRGSEGVNSFWMNTRTVYFFAGLIISLMYLNFMRQRTSHSTRTHPMQFHDFVPLIFSIFGLGLSWVINRTTRPAPQYSVVDDDTGDIVFRDNSDGGKRK